jgi:hypothetical protein
MRYAASLFALVVMVQFCTGCATIITGAGEDQAVRFASNPRGATVYVDDNPVGQTPVSVRLTRKDDHHIRIEHAGYKPYERTITSGFNEWILGNIFIGGLVGLSVDLLSGANPALDTNNVSARMLKDPNTALVAVPPPPPPQGNAPTGPPVRAASAAPPAAAAARPAAYMNATPTPVASPPPAAPAAHAAPAYTPPPAYQPPPPYQQPAAPAAPAAPVAPAAPAARPAPARQQPQPAPAKPYQGW